MIPSPAPNLETCPARDGQASVSTPDFSTLLLKPGQHNEEILREMGLSPEEMSGLTRSGALGSVHAKL